MATNDPKPIPQLSQKDIESFWAQVDTRPGQGPHGDCHEWQGGRFSKQYGAFSPHRGMIARAHRIAYYLTTGDDPGSLFVLHSCDNPPCCNPAHLWKDTHQANVEDRDNKGHKGGASGSLNGMYTHPEARGIGERNAGAKFSAHDVQEIRRKYATGEYTLTDLGKEYGTHFAYISLIVNRKRWTHI
jgi:hypothetical protein